MSKVIIVGGGAAGMMAGVTAARNGHQVILLERNEKLGKKLYITGKGRCNLTNACDREELKNHIVTNKKFLFRSFYQFTNFDTISFFEELGLETKIERGGRVFPKSDHSSDVLRVLEEELHRLCVEIHYNSRVTEIIAEKNCFVGIRLDNRDTIWKGERLILATGGCSYPSTGSTGDGYKFALQLGHHLNRPTPALVPLETEESFVKELQGLSLKNIGIVFRLDGKKIYEDFGELLFTHFGVSGPVILSGSSYGVSYLEEGKKLKLTIDLKPALTVEQLDGRVLRDFAGNTNKNLGNALDDLLPKKLIPIILKEGKLDPLKKVNSITKEERSRLVMGIKNLELTITKSRGPKEAIITQGGINIKEVNPSTMESLLVKNVFFAGELLDLDALTGGYNLQIAWSTAYAAAKGLEKEKKKGMRKE